MRSRKRLFRALVEKEWRELLVSRAWWVLLAAMGPLVGLSFISAIRTYAEVSGFNGTAAGVGEALSPLIGVWAPTFSACELAAVFLLPFVAIRLVGGDRQSGALRLELQNGLPGAVLIAAKALVAAAGWLIAMLPPLGAIVLWKSYGGAVYAPEMAGLVAGHVLNACLTIALGAATAAVTEHPSTAAILTLSVTVGTWLLDFFGAVHGGWWERAAGYTPAAMVAEFQHGLVRLDVVLIASILILAGFGLAAIWIRLGVAVRRRFYASVVLAAGTAAGVTVCTRVRGSWDLSENRGNSFSVADEAALRKIREPLDIEVHLAPEDPRRVDLERRVLSKLRRLMPQVRIAYVASSSIGLFEQTGAGYGEVRYSLGHRTVTSRATTEEAALEVIYGLAGITPSASDGDPVFRGHPLAVEPRGAGAIFFLLWPGLVAAAAILARRSLA